MRRSALQPRPQLCDCGILSLRNDLDRTVRHVACAAADSQPIRLEAGAVPKKDALDFPKNEKPPGHFVQGRPSARQRRGRFGVLRIGTGESRGSMTLGFHRRHSSPRELLCLQMGFRTPDGGLGRAEVRRCRACRACRLRRCNRLSSVAQFLHGSRSATGEACNNDKYSKEAQHRVHGH